MMGDARFGRLRDRLGELHRRSRALARQLGDIDLSDLRSPADLALVPVMRKSALAEMQRAEPPFGALAAAPTSAFGVSSPPPAASTNPNPPATIHGARREPLRPPASSAARSWSTAFP